MFRRYEYRAFLRRPRRAARVSRNKLIWAWDQFFKEPRRRVGPAGQPTQHAIISHYFPWAREGISGGPFIYFAGSSKKIWLHRVRWNIVHATDASMKGPSREKKGNALVKDDWHQSRSTNIYHAWSRERKRVAEPDWYYILILHDVFQLLVGRAYLFQRGVSVLSRREPFTEQFYKIATCISFRAKRARSRCRIQLLKRAAATLWQKLKYLNHVKMWRPQIYGARDPYFLFIRRTPARLEPV